MELTSICILRLMSWNYLYSAILMSWNLSLYQFKTHVMELPLSAILMSWNYLYRSDSCHGTTSIGITRVMELPLSAILMSRNCLYRPRINHVIRTTSISNIFVSDCQLHPRNAASQTGALQTTKIYILGLTKQKRPTRKRMLCSQFSVLGENTDAYCPLASYIHGTRQARLVHFKQQKFISPALDAQ